MTTRQFDVVVVGAGMIGAAAACLFAEQGLRVGVVEAGTLDEVRDERVSALNIAAVNVLQTIGVWAELSARASRYETMRVWDSASAARIEFSAAGLRVACLGYLLHNREVIAALRAKLRASYQVEMFAQTELVSMSNGDGRVDSNSDSASDINSDDNRNRHRIDNNDSLHLHLSNGATIQTELLVGADGAQSRVRELCAIDSSMVDFHQDAIAAIVQCEQSHQSIARQCFLSSGPVAMLPLAQRQCAVVWSCDRGDGARNHHRNHNVADELYALEDDAFCARLAAVFGELGAMQLRAPRRRFALMQRHAETYLGASTALIGDAAHSIHPLAGLGANLGFIDAAALVETVGDARARKLRIGKRSVLRRYERRRKGDNAATLSAMLALRKLFAAHGAPMQTIRAAGVCAVDACAPLKHQLARRALGLSGDLPAVCRGGV